MDELEGLLAEFFNPATSNDRKRVIESILETQNPTTSDCQYMLQNAASDYMGWFAASQYEKIIQRDWLRLSTQDQLHNRAFLLDFLRQHFRCPGATKNSNGTIGRTGTATTIVTPSGASTAATSPTKPVSAFVLKKVIKLLTDIALQDWPDRFQDLFPDIMNLIQQPTTAANHHHQNGNSNDGKDRDLTTLGWTLLLEVLQEFAALDPAALQQREPQLTLQQKQHRQHMWDSFKNQIPDIIQLILGHLDHQHEKSLVTPLSTEAPVPSPVESSIWNYLGGGASERSGPGTLGSIQSSAIHLPSYTFIGSYASRAVPGSMASSFNSQQSLLDQGSSFQAFGHHGHGLAAAVVHGFNGGHAATQSSIVGQASFGTSPTTMLRKTLTSFLGSGLPTGSPAGAGHMHMNLGGGPTGFESPNSMQHSPMASSPSLIALHASRQRIGSISGMGSIPFRRGSNVGIHMAHFGGAGGAAGLGAGGRRPSEAVFIHGNRMDSHTRTTCLLALQSLNCILSYPGLDPNQNLLFAPTISTILRYATLHQTKTVDMGTLALGCLNDLVARPGFLATNTVAMTSAVKVMSDLVRYFNEVEDGIDDIDEKYLQKFMHFMSLFCELEHLQRAERTLGLSIPDFITSFSIFTLEKVSVDNLKTCLELWKSLLESMIQFAADTPRPIPVQHALTRFRTPLQMFMNALVDKFYKLKGAQQVEDAFSAWEIEDFEDLQELTDLVEGFVGQMGELFLEQVTELLYPLLAHQLNMFEQRHFLECKTLPVTLGILARVCSNYLDLFDLTREFASTLVIELTRKSRLAIDTYLEMVNDNGVSKSLEREEIDHTGKVVLALLKSLEPFLPWLSHLWQVEQVQAITLGPEAPVRIAQDIYQEQFQIFGYVFESMTTKIREFESSMSTSGSPSRPTDHRAPSMSPNTQSTISWLPPASSATLFSSRQNNTQQPVPKSQLHHHRSTLSGSLTLCSPILRQLQVTSAECLQSIARVVQVPAGYDPTPCQLQYQMLQSIEHSRLLCEED